MRKSLIVGATIIGAAVLVASPISVKLSTENRLSVSQDKATAAVGNPLSAGSAAGVHRRHERREQRHTTPPK